MNEIEKGEYRVILVTSDTKITLGGFEKKEDAEKFAKSQAPNYPRSTGLVCLIWQRQDSNMMKFYDIYN